jgi:NAD(P)-dependent dehydrogenase (short-subunit alcohol dehydrogenase family)
LFSALAVVGDQGHGHRQIVHPTIPLDVEPRATEIFGSQAEFINADVRIADDVRALVDKTVARFGRLDVAARNSILTTSAIAVGDGRLANA